MRKPAPRMCKACGKKHKPHRVNPNWNWQWDQHGHALVDNTCECPHCGHVHKPKKTDNFVRRV